MFYSIVYMATSSTEINYIPAALSVKRNRTHTHIPELEQLPSGLGSHGRVWRVPGTISNVIQPSAHTHTHTQMGVVELAGSHHIVLNTIRTHKQHENHIADSFTFQQLHLKGCWECSPSEGRKLACLSKL